ncbi:MAG TPA: hypothetical protein VKU40_16700 [Thermoanaerobaculia bacterium]|nr:hypothetical protein [Thermoanaerobaculia bacterium]
MSEPADSARDLLRHSVATVAYRGGKAVRGAPPEFADFRPVSPAGKPSRTPGEILAHVGDLYDWALHLADGEHVWHDSEPLPWPQEVERFFAALARFDDRLAAGAPLGSPAEKLFQGPVADSLQHVGQLTYLRRLAGVPIRGENYYRADVSAGRVGAEQAAPRSEFN